MFIVEVRWVRPSDSEKAPTGKLSLRTLLGDTEYFNWFVDAGDNAERFGLFQSRGDAEAFKSEIEGRYKQRPTYTVGHDSRRIEWQPDIRIVESESTTRRHYTRENFPEILKNISAHEQKRRLNQEPHFRRAVEEFIDQKNPKGQE